MEAAHKQDAPLLKTALWPLHTSMGGKMVPFAGYDMPVQYDGMGVLKEHVHTRSEAGLFDVSHMGQAILTGNAEDPAIALETIVPGDIIGLEPGKMRYTVLLNDDGGIIDDLMVTRWDARTLLVVVNAACKDKDFAFIQQKIGDRTKLQYLGDRALLALQGPKAEQVASIFFPDVLTMKFMESVKTQYKGHEIFLSRSGYTGEDGFEISVPNGFAEEFTKELLQEPEVKLIGLGARDSLRLEAGLCLYGHDIDDHSTPIDANLKWVIPKRRREQGGFPGYDKIKKQLDGGTYILRVGIKPEGRAPIREKTELFIGDKKVGVITSGGFGPTVDGPVAMGYVNADVAKPGTKLNAMLRGVARPCEIVALPFVKNNYKKD
ncbi:MAG TPA: glycine cleavage system aminomethyltransferase GcvT [Patescibacteria group bacterium]|nr:glycine cleavage system aminomethyltransferase GcvT [Patescibacteria group bacterium]